MTPAEYTTAKDCAVKAAARYIRRAPWCNRDDLEQTAWSAMLDAIRRYDPTRGVPLGGYLWRVCVLALHRAVHNARVPVSAHHRPGVLRGLRAVEITYSGSDEDTCEERAEVSASSRIPTPAAANEDREFIERVQARIAALLGAANVPFALGILGGEWSPREIARAHGVDVLDLYAARQQIRHVLWDDPELYALHRSCMGTEDEPDECK